VENEKKRMATQKDVKIFAIQDKFGVFTFNIYFIIIIEVVEHGSLALHRS
jgi:hypothetical protein